MMETSGNYDIQAAERLFKKVVHPGLNTMKIVDRNGLPLQSPVSQIRPRSFVLSPRGVPTKVPDHAYSGRPTNRYTDISTSDTPELISPERFGRQSASPDSKPITRQYSSSQMSKKRAVSTTPVFNRPVPMTKSASTQRYLSGVPSEKRSLTDNRSRWNTSSQGYRLENEWDNLSKCRALKRSSEIVGHRVDRMYFMSGNSITLQPKYHVNDEELSQLKEIAKTRQTTRPARSSRLGRMSIHSSTSRKSHKKDIDHVDTKKSENTNQDGGNQKEEEKKKEEKPLGINGLKITTGRKSPLQGWGDGDRQNMESDRNEIIATESLHNDTIKNNKNDNEDVREKSVPHATPRDASHDFDAVGTEITDTDIMFDEFQRKEMQKEMQNVIEEEETNDNTEGAENNDNDTENKPNHRPDGRQSGELVNNNEDTNNDDGEDFTFVREDEDENKSDGQAHTE